MKAPTKQDRAQWAAHNCRVQAYARKSKGYKTRCTTACIESFGIPTDNLKYVQCVLDVVRVLRQNGYSVRSRASKVEGLTVGKLRNIIKSRKLGIGVFLIRVPGHVLLLDYNGKTITDTDPRQRDKRKITHAYLVTRK